MPFFRQSDKAIIAAITKKIGEPKEVKYDDKGHVIELSLSEKGPAQLPLELWQLTHLQKLHLMHNRLTHLPPEIGRLTHLQELVLDINQLTHLPPEIGQLTNLQELQLNFNRLTQLPPEIGQLTNLKELSLVSNQLTQLPPEIGQLTNLQKLYLMKNPLISPPREIVKQGGEAVLAYLRELLKERDQLVTRYEAKLLFVGEGAVGKSSLLRALRGEVFDSQLDTTRGVKVEVGRLKLLHPRQPRTEITLNTWDFGGQRIYHATHQLFFTHRSLYVVVWNARQGAEQGRLTHWLDTLQALASDAPVLLVATHTDECAPDVDAASIRRRYPQVAGLYAVSNKTGAGLAEFKVALAVQAAGLPLVQQTWPRAWIQAERALLARPENCLERAEYAAACAAHGVDRETALGVLGGYWHDLGKLLYFQHDELLNYLVILKPNWVTRAISLVLDDSATRAANGILAHADLPRIWTQDGDGRPYEPHLYPVLLRLMEHFELSYQLEPSQPGARATHSLIPQLLPTEPPAGLPPWPTCPPEGQQQVEMVYHLGFVPAGLMSRFIVRTHRYTQNRHWRHGALLAYQGQQARVELEPQANRVRLAVWGAQPHNLFTLLANTMDAILASFDHLEVERLVPCICHWQRGEAEPCLHFYRYDQLAARMDKRRYDIECPDSGEMVSVPKLLYGIHPSTLNEFMDDLWRGQQKLEKQISEGLSQQAEMFTRYFTRLWNLEANKLGVECPNMFVLMPGDRHPFDPRNWISTEYTLYLVCQHPAGPHIVGKGYVVRKSQEWWKQISPWLKTLLDFLKCVPMTKTFLGVLGDDKTVEQLKAGIGRVEEILKVLPLVPTFDDKAPVKADPRLGQNQPAVGAALRALHSFLKEADPNEQWGGLDKLPTPDGNILWLCEEHRQQYEAKPLQI